MIYQAYSRKRFILKANYVKCLVRQEMNSAKLLQLKMASHPLKVFLQICKTTLFRIGKAT
jgi:hypothetical protein